MSHPSLVIGFKNFHDERVPYVKYNSRTVYLIGTKHTDTKYVIVVEKAIRSVKPDLVGVELCRTRIGYKNTIARQINKYKEFDFEKIPKHKRLAAVAEKLRLLYVYGAIQYQKSKAFRITLGKYKLMRTYRLNRAVTMDKTPIGAEIYVPFRNLVWRKDNKFNADSYLTNPYTSYKILLMDRPIEQTYINIANALSEEEKDLIKTYKEGFPSYFQDGYGILMASLWENNPKLQDIFLNQRDDHMARMLFKAVTKNKFTRIIGIIGKSHLDGVMKQLINLLIAKATGAEPESDSRAVPVKTMDEQLQELCDFFEKLNRKPEDGEDGQRYTKEASIEDVRKFDRFLQETGGHTGGWAPLEHTVFQKLIRTHNINSVIHIFRLNFPDISGEEISHHSDWYNNYIKMKSKQEHALRYWRLKKQRTHLNNFSNEIQNVNKIKITPKADKSLKLKILKWKEDRQKIKEDAEKKRELEQKVKSEEEKARNLLNQEKKKTMALEYRKEKEAMKIADRLIKENEQAAEKKQRAIRANKMLHLYRKKDIELIENINKKKLMKFQKQHERQRVIENLASKTRKTIQASRDPIRLLIPTVEWMQKMNTRYNKTSEPDRSTTITKIQHLTTPTWRKSATGKIH